jgi:diaminohydroxyphosphoribosylaminopyrimidine deaminase / 5-amino-6-(5-phosphoribosylamino)uracil reductase
MRAAVEAAAAVRSTTSPNPWVGTVVIDSAGMIVGTGATQPPGGPHAEREALRRAGAAAAGGTLVTTLEPCGHTGRTPPCVEAIVEAGIRRVVVGIEDPDPQVAGRGIAALRAAGVDVTIGVEADVVSAQLAPYLTHRRTGRPYVVLKLAATVDGRTAAPDGTSRWITGEEARADAHRLRAESDAVLVGAGTVRADNPSLTVRHVAGRDPLRVVLGRAPAGARVHPCVELGGDLGDVLDELGRRDVVQLLVEGGATVAHAFHASGLVDRYVVYLAPALMGGDDALGLFRGRAVNTIGDLRRGHFASVTRLGADLRIEIDL